jgi:hypothetical protein
VGKGDEVTMEGGVRLLAKGALVRMEEDVAASTLVTGALAVATMAS